MVDANMSSSRSEDRPLLGLGDRLDFDRGLKFQDEVRRTFKSPVHHPFPSPEGSFYMLVTFRRFLFRLSEDSVGLALQSCLGGRAAEFHVTFQSHNHYRISVFSKEVGFYIYRKKRITTPQFDVYFHLWHNGTPNWEKEKRDWELEQEKEWTLVLSRAAKRKAKCKETVKKVRFAKPIVQKSTSSNSLAVQSLRVGSVLCPLGSVFSALPNKVVPCSSPSSSQAMISPNLAAGKQSEFSNSNQLGQSVGQSVVCFRCLELGHMKRACKSDIRCARCWKLGHLQSRCKEKFASGPKRIWRPKSLLTHTEPSISWRPACTQALEKEISNLTDSPEPSSKENSAPDFSHSVSSLEHIDQEEATVNPNPSQSPPVIQSAPATSQSEMANFEVNPLPYIPAGFDLEHWVRPSRGRMVLAGNPPRRHEEFAIATLFPAPQQNVDQIHNAIHEVIDYFEHTRHVRILSACPSPLGLCLLEFRSAVVRQTMIFLNPHFLPGGREIRLEAHDDGLNLRESPFTRICWVMFLCFPLDYQARSYIEQAVNLFGTVLDIPNNVHCRSRVLVRCAVLHPSRIPRSLLVCRAAVVGAAGRSWTVPVFILNSQNNEEGPGNEDLVPIDGDPHPLLGNLQEQQPAWFDDMQENDDAEQEVEVGGWNQHIPDAAPAAPLENNGWPAWPQPLEEVNDNEVQQMQNMADNLVQQAMLIQQNQQQVSDSVSSDVLDFYRAQGPPIRMEVPILENRDAIVPIYTPEMDTEDDYPIIQMANSLGLHLGLGPLPSVQMLLQDVLWATASAQAIYQIPRPIALGFAQFPGSVVLSSSFLSKLHIGYSEFPETLRASILRGKQPVQYTEHIPDHERYVEFLKWGNNAEASCSKPRQFWGNSAEDDSQLMVLDTIQSVSVREPNSNHVRTEDRIAEIAKELNDHGILSSEYSYPQLTLEDWEDLRLTYLGNLVTDTALESAHSESVLFSQDHASLAPFTQNLQWIQQSTLSVEAHAKDVTDLSDHEHLHTPMHFSMSENGNDVASHQAMLSVIQPAEDNSAVLTVTPLQMVPPTAPKIRKTRKRATPIVDDEVKRSARISKDQDYVHMELDERCKPRKLFKEDTSMLKITMQEAIDEAVNEDQMLPIALMQEVAINFCGVAPEDATREFLSSEVTNDDKSP